MVFAAVALLGLGAGGGVVYENAHWEPIYLKTSHDLGAAKQDATDFQRLALTEEGELDTLHKKIADEVGDIDHPAFILWNACGSGGPTVGCPLTPGREYVGGVPDTFTYYVNFRSTVPVTISIMSAENFVCFETRTCVSHYVGWTNQTELHSVFHDAEGCAGYFVVLRATRAGTLYPDIRVSHNPASHSTGACA